MRLRTPTIALALALVALALPAPASAGSGQIAIFQDDALIVERGAAVRDAALAEIAGLGADMIKVQVRWDLSAPGGKREPAGFDGRDPAQYPGFGLYAEVLAAAKAHGLQVMFTLAPPAPSWATRGSRGPYEGVDRPSAREFGRFAEAAARRFPEVDVWSLWNEPSLAKYLYPQSRGGVPFAPHLYRRMVRAAVAGLRRGGSGGDPTLFGELQPIGAKRCCFAKANLQPIRFIRELFCLDSSYRSLGGRAARLRGCEGFRRLGGLDGFAYHPYTRPGGPDLVEPSTDDATIRSLERVTGALDRARARGRIGGGRLGLWITEFGFQSRPPDPQFGVPLARIPHFMALSELWIARRNRRVRSYSQYTMIDTPIVDGDTGSWQSGLRFADGSPKEDVYAMYRLPLFVRVLGPSAIEVHGAARPGGAGSTVQVQQRRGRGRFENFGQPISIRNSRGYFRQRLRIRKAAMRRYRIVSGGQTSPAVRPVARFG